MVNVRNRSRMRIAAWKNRPSGGGKGALENQVRGLVANGHHVEVWCPNSANVDFLPLSKHCPEHVRPIRLCDDHPRGFIARNSLIKMRQKMRGVEEHARCCAREISDGGFDVL